MGFDIGSIATGAANGIFGLFLGDIANQRQLEQQQKLQQMQIQGAKEMTMFNREQALQMWKDTNYGPQVEQMKKAGLNPALMYGMGGGGGTTASVPSGNVSGGQANAGNTMEAVGMAMQLGLMKAQKENIEADTRNKLKQGTESWVRAEGMEYDNILKNLLVNKDQQGKDIEPGKDHERVAFQQAIAEMNQKYATAALARAGVGKTEEERNKIATEISQMAQKLKNETDQVEIQKKLAEFQTSFGNQAATILGHILGLTKGR